MNLLVEAVGSPAWPTLLPFLRPVAHRIVALEVDPLSVGAPLVDACILVPPYAELDSPELLLRICRDEGVDQVLPTVHEGLPLWAAHRETFRREGVEVVISPPETVAIFHDKWRTYEFFRDCGVPTPETSLDHLYELVKPRVGRGGQGLRRTRPGTESLEGCISQRFVRGREVSVDVLCDRAGRAVYSVQRERLAVESGLAVRARVIFDERIDRGVERIVSSARFLGIVNIQCFVEEEGVVFTEVNPRIPGGLSLSLAATENWFARLRRALDGAPFEPVAPKLGLTMLRHWSDVFVPADGPGARPPPGEKRIPWANGRSAFSS